MVAYNQNEYEPVNASSQQAPTYNAGPTGIMGGSQPSGAGGGGYQGAGGGGLQNGSGGNFIDGVGNYFGFGKPTTLGHYQGPQVNRNDYYLGGSADASQGLMSASDARAAGYAGRSGPGFDPRMAQGNLAQAEALRANEARLTQMLEDQAAGRGPSVAADAYTKAAGDATRRAQSIATSARGGAGLLGARQAAEVGFQGGQDAALQSGMIRKQEMLDARGLLGQQLAQRNQANLGRAGMGLDIARTQTGFGMQQQGMNDAAEQAERGRYLQMLQLQQGGLMGYNQAQGGFDQGANQLNAGLDQTNLGQQNAQDAKRGGLFKKALGFFGF